MKKNIERMIADIESEAIYTSSYIGKNKFDDRVMDAMGKLYLNLISSL